ncbi:MAG: 6-pyruvoyl-tetrahydropterin synthase-related protein [Patescibacteria group bacterium]
MWPFIFSIVVAFPVILPYLREGYFPTHDGEWAVVRLTDMFRTLRDFQIPARYSGNLNFGYGYPLFNFVYPFPYYFGTFMHFLGFGFVNTIKILFAASVFLSAFFMFFASRILWKNTWAGVISMIMYTYFPYRMVDLYVRGSIGESLSFVLFPLLFYLAIKLVDKASVFLVGGIGISVGVLIMTHNIMTVLFMPIFITFSLSQIILKKKKVIKKFIVSIILGFGISAFFWIPALFEKNNILLSKIPIADRNLYFVRLDQFLLPRWGYGAPTDPNGFSYQFGLVHLAVFLITIFSLVFIFVKDRKGFKEYFTKIAFIPIIISLLFTFLLFKPSDFLWSNIPLLSEINYPWIALGILGFLVSLLAGFLCRQKYTRYIVICVSLISIIMYLPYAKPQYYVDRRDNYYLTNEATTTSSNELMPLWVKKFPSQRPVNKVEIIKRRGNIENIFSNSKQVKFSINALSQSTVRINTIYYPGWKAKVDGNELPIYYRNDKGVMQISVPSGTHKVEASFNETPLRLTSNGISLLSFFALLFIGAKGFYRRNNKN